MEVGKGRPEVLLACRDLVTLRLRATVTRVVDEAALSMERQTLGGSLSTPGAANFDAVRELRQRRGEFAVRFEHCFNEIFEQRLGAELVTSASNLSAGCRSLLLEIDRRLEGLLQGARIPSAAGLMEPEALVAAFDHACSGLAGGDGVRRVLQDSFRRQVHLDLPRVYGEVNSLLVRHGLRATKPARREGEGATVPFSTFPGRRPTVYSQGRSRQVEPVDDATLQSVRDLINARAVPYFVRAFAQESWARVMARIRADKGADSAEWQRARKTLEDLIVTVEMFGNSGCRRVAVWGLPGLVQRLKTGMSSVNIPQQEQVLFLKTLRAHQLRVLGQREVHAGMLPAPDADDD